MSCNSVNLLLIIAPHSLLNYNIFGKQKLNGAVIWFFFVWATATT